jgi:hypothetical protein
MERITSPGVTRMSRTCRELMALPCTISLELPFNGYVEVDQAPINPLLARDFEPSSPRFVATPQLPSIQEVS